MLLENICPSFGGYGNDRISVVCNKYYSSFSRIVGSFSLQKFFTLQKPFENEKLVNFHVFHLSENKMS